MMRVIMWVFGVEVASMSYGVGVGFRTSGGVVGNGGEGVILGMDLTPPAKDGPIDPVEFTAAMIRRFWSGGPRHAHSFFPSSQFSLVSLGQS